MKRVLSLLLSLLLVLGSFPVFADEVTYGEMLAQMDLVKGDGEGNLMEGDALTRAQMMVILARLYGVEEEARSFVLPSTFTDVEADSYYASFIAYGQMEGWTIGYGDGTFGPDDTLTADHTATFLLRVLGYSTSVDFQWDDAIEFAASLGIDVTAGIGDEGEILRGEVFELMYKALYTENVDGVLLAVQLGLEEPEPEVLEVVSVEALNLIQIEVVFNTEVDADTAEDDANYAVEDEDYTVDTATLQDDGKTVILLLESEADQQEESTVTVEDVEALDNEDMVVADTEMEIQFLDMDIPVITGAENVGNDTFKVYFSEPMKEGLTDKSNYEVNDGAKYIRQVTAGSSNLSAYVEMYSDLEDGEYSIFIEGVEDYAGFTALPKTFTVNVEEDTEAPYIAGYKDATPNGVTLIWNEDIEFAVGSDIEELDNNDEYVYHTNDSNEAETAIITDNEMALTFSDDYLLPEGTAYVYVAEEVVNDLWDIENDQQMVKIEVELDTTPPAVDEIEVEDYELKITFTEKVEFDDEEFTFLDDEGDEVSVGNPGGEGTDTLTFDVEDLDGEYTLVMEGIVDLARPTANEMPATTIEFEVLDEEAPEHDAFSAVLYNAGEEDQMIKVDFGEAMATDGVYAVTNMANYEIQAELIVGTGTDMDDIDYELSDLDSDVSIVVVDGGEAVEIYIPTTDEDEEYGLDLMATDAGIQIGRVADLEGNYTVTYGAYVDVDEQGFVYLSAAVATDIDTIEVTLDDELADFEADDFYIDIDGTTEGVIIGVDTELNDDDETVIVFTLHEDYELAYNGLYGGVTEAVVWTVASGILSENIYGEALAAGDSETVVDEIKPEIVVFDDGDDEYDVVFNYMTTSDVIEGDSEATTFSVIDIFFEEAIDPMSVSLDTFEVGGGDYEVLAIYVEGIQKDVGTDMTTYGYITLIVENEDADDLEGVQIDQQSAIRDLNGNTTTGIETEIVDIEAVMPWLEDFAPPS